MIFLQRSISPGGRMDKSGVSSYKCGEAGCNFGVCEMKFALIAAIVGVSTLASPVVAAAEQPVGKVTAVTSNVFVARGGKMIPAYVGQPVRKGDKIVTRGKSAAKVSITGCGYKMVSKTVLAVDTDCTSRSMVNAAQDQGGPGAGHGRPTTTDIIVGGFALTAYTVGVVTLLESNSNPVSP